MRSEELGVSHPDLFWDLLTIQFRALSVLMSKSPFILSIFGLFFLVQAKTPPRQNAESIIRSPHIILFSAPLRLCEKKIKRRLA